jgi:hypothetical protein
MTTLGALMPISIVDRGCGLLVHLSCCIARGIKVTDRYSRHMVFVTIEKPRYIEQPFGGNTRDSVRVVSITAGYRDRGCQNRGILMGSAELWFCYLGNSLTQNAKWKKIA